MTLRKVSDDEEFWSIHFSRFPVILYFQTKWCPPCVPTKKIIESHFNEFSNRNQVIQIDGDKCSQLVAKYNIFALPTLLLIDSQFQVIKSLIGHHPQKLKQFLSFFEEKTGKS